MSNWTLKEASIDNIVLCGVRVTDLIGLVFSGNDGKIYKTEDGGVAWTKVKELGNESPVQTYIRSATLVDTDIIICGSQPDMQIWKSSDGGDTWTMKQDISLHASFNYDNFGGTSFVLGEAVTWNAGADSGIVVACSNGNPTGTMTIAIGSTSAATENNDSISAAGSGASCDVNGSMTWETDDSIFSMCTVNPNGASSICLLGTGSDDAQMFRSTDAGDTWLPVTIATASVRINDIKTVYEHATNGVVLASEYSTCKIWRSTDSGATWTMIEDIASESRVYFAVMKQNATTGVIVAAATGSAEIWRSTDSGATWTRISSFSGYTHPYSICVMSENAVMVALQNSGTLAAAIFKSVDQGLTWSQINDILEIEDTTDSRYWRMLVRLSDSNYIGGGSLGDIYLWQFTGTPGDYLGWVAPDNEEILSLAPHEVLFTEPIRRQVTYTFDDTSDVIISLDDSYTFYADIQWNLISAANSGVVSDFYYSPDKGDGIAKSFLFTHPEDGYTYTVRFVAGPGKSLYPAGRHTIPARLKILGIYNGA